MLPITPKSQGLHQPLLNIRYSYLLPVMEHLLVNKAAYPFQLLKPSAKCPINCPIPGLSSFLNPVIIHSFCTFLNQTDILSIYISFLLNLLG